MPKQSIDKVYSVSGNSSWGNLFIGNLEAASSLQTLKRHGIQAVVTVAKGKKLNYSDRELPDYLYIPALDNSNFDLTIYFDQSSSFIHKCLRCTNVLVHCVAGISRSATLVIAYLMRQMSQGASEVIKTLQTKREIVNPNPGFRLQLRFYQCTLKHQKLSKTIKDKTNLLSPQPELILTEQLNKPQAKEDSFAKPHRPYRQYSLTIHKHSTQSDISTLSNRGESLEKFRKSNFKLQSKRKCFEKMVLNNNKKVEERLAKSSMQFDI